MAYRAAGMTDDEIMDAMNDLRVKRERERLIAIGTSEAGGDFARKMAHFTRWKLLDIQSFGTRLKILRDENYVKLRTREVYEHSVLRIQGLRTHVQRRADHFRENKNDSAEAAMCKVLAQIDAALLKEGVRLGYVQPAQELEDEIGRSAAAPSPENPQSTPTHVKPLEEMTPDELERYYSSFLSQAK